MSKKGEIRNMPPDRMGGGLVRFMTTADGYVMVRRRGCMPFVVSLKEWDSWKEDL